MVVGTTEDVKNKILVVSSVAEAPSSLIASKLRNIKYDISTEMLIIILKFIAHKYVIHC